MFNIVLKFILYSILTVCILWGIVLFAGPKILVHVATNKFGETVQLHNLRINPKLTLSVSRIEFSNLRILPDKVSRGSIRAVKLNWEASNNLIPKIKVSSGPLILDNSTSFEDARFEIDVSNIWSSSYADFKFDINAINSSDFITVQNIYGSGSLNLRNLNLKNFDVSGFDLASLGYLKLNAPSFSGSIKGLQFDTNINLESIEDLEFMVPDLNLLPQNYKAHDLSMNFNLSKDLGYLKIDISDVSGENKNTSASNVELSASLSSLDFSGWDKITLQIGSLSLPNTPYLASENNLQNFSTVIEKNLREELILSSQGDFGHFELVNQGNFLVDLSGSKLTFEASILPKKEASGFLSSRVILRSMSQPSVLLDGEVEALISGADYTSCIKNAACLSKIWSKYKLEIEGNKLIGYWNCQFPSCYELGAEHTVESENTDKFFQSAIKSQIFNPFALSVIYGNISSGQKTGNGHLFKF